MAKQVLMKMSMLPPLVFFTSICYNVFLSKYCQARVQVRNPLSQQIPNPDPV